MKINKLKVYKNIFRLLMLATIIVAILIIIKYTGYQIVEQENKEIVEIFNEEVKKNTENLEPTIEMNGYKVIGKIKISSINIEYPILNITSEKSLKTSITRYAGNDVNSLGNLTLAGHNNKDGTMFGKLKRLVIGDIIELTDLRNNVIQYKVYNIFKIEPDDISITNTNDENVREITLYTCSNGHTKRLVVKAKEI